MDLCQSAANQSGNKPGFTVSDCNGQVSGCEDLLFLTTTADLCLSRQDQRLVDGDPGIMAAGPHAVHTLDMHTRLTSYNELASPLKNHEQRSRALHVCWNLHVLRDRGSRP